MLRESDMTGEKYRRLLEQYADHPDSERITAHEMGWTWLENALEEQETADAEDAGDQDENDVADDSATVATRNNLAMVLLRRGIYAEAEAELRLILDWQ